MVKILQLFWSFFKIGAFTIGGGYAMIPLMEKELVSRRQWIDKEEFLDILSLSQAMPGIFAVNMATNIGFRLSLIFNPDGINTQDASSKTFCDALKKSYPSGSNRIIPLATTGAVKF